MQEGNYKAIAKCDLSLPDAPATWRMNEDYECYVYEDGSICLATDQGGNTYFMAHKIDELKDMFEFMGA